MPHISSHLIPRNLADDSLLWEKYAWRTRPVRLDSLRLDPESFISQHDSEVKQPIDFTIGRLKEKNAWTVVLVRTPSEAASWDPDVLLRDDTEYVGFCVMIDIRETSESMAEREGVNHQLQGADWFMAAVYVDRSVRGTGAGKKMIQYGINTAREVSKEWGRSAVCLTTVRHGNDNALELYRGLGFKITDTDKIEEKEGRVFHCTELKMTL